ncbi:MAG: DegT/DnrJ/EryC1/StrS family aminotransferase, partial [Methanomicrobiales archaeon]
MIKQETTPNFSKNALLLSYQDHKIENNAAVRRVLESGRYILGNEVNSFEEEFSRYIGVDYGIGVGNGTDAITLALKACGIGPGDEVITVSHTAVATVAAIELSRATPVLVDISPDTYTLDPDH